MGSVPITCLKSQKRQPILCMEDFYRAVINSLSPIYLRIPTSSDLPIIEMHLEERGFLDVSDV